MSIETIRSLPHASKFCFLVATAIAGRNVVPAIGCKIGSIFIDFIDKKNALVWRKSSHDYWTKAKKDATRDLIAVAGFIILGIGAAYSGELDKVEEKDEKIVEKPTRKKEKVEEKVKKQFEKVEKPDNQESYTETFVKEVYDFSIRSIPVIKDSAKELLAFSVRSTKTVLDTLGGTIEGLCDLASQYRAPLIDTISVIGVGTFSNHIRTKYLGGDPLRKFAQFSREERTFLSRDNKQIKLTQWFFMNQPPEARIKYHRSHNPNFQS